MRSHRLVPLAAAAAAAVAALALISVPATALPTNPEEGYGQVSFVVDTLPQDLGSWQADGNPCEELSALRVEARPRVWGPPGNDGTILRTTKDAQLTFRGYASTDCSGQPTSVVVRTFGDPTWTWADGSIYEVPWQSN